jgi:hypothetical protein
MTSYCLENGIDDSEGSIVHKLHCRHYDLGSLLGAGRLVCLGEFDSSATALEYARESRPDAARCLECCHTDLVLPVQILPGFLRQFATA